MHRIVYAIIITMLITVPLISAVNLFQDYGEVPAEWGSDANCGGASRPWDFCTICSGGAEGDIDPDISEYSGTYAIRGRDFDGDCKALEQTIDLTGYGHVNFTFKYTCYGVDANEYGTLKFYDGSWHDIFVIDSSDCQSDATPESVDYSSTIINLEEVDYDFDSGNKFAWHYDLSGASDLVWYDEFSVDAGGTASPSTCTCPSINNDWNVDMRDNCVMNTDCNLGTGKLNLTYGGTFTCNATLNSTGFGDLFSGQTVYVKEDCIINIA